MDKPKLIIFASGTKTGGGSGFENLVEHSRGGDLDAEIVAVVSNHKDGGVCEHAEHLGVPFIHFSKPHDANGYQRILKESGAGWVMLSGWLKLVFGLDPARTINIHPALLTLLNGKFGGVGMYGHYVHEAVADALSKGEVSESGVTMHFVTEEYDRGPIFFEKRVPLTSGMSADEIGRAVNRVEHEYQPKITNLVLSGEISWDGKDPKTLVVPEDYKFLPRALAR